LRKDGAFAMVEVADRAPIELTLHIAAGVPLIVLPPSRLPTVLRASRLHILMPPSRLHIVVRAPRLHIQPAGAQAPAAPKPTREGTREHRSKSSFEAKPPKRSKRLPFAPPAAGALHLPNFPRFFLHCN
jgi:hypothetical protein